MSLVIVIIPSFTGQLLKMPILGFYLLSNLTPESWLHWENLLEVFTVFFIQLHISANIWTPSFIVSISDFKRKEYIQQQIIGSRVSSGFVGTSEYTIIGFHILTRSGQDWNRKREVGVINQKLLIYSVRVSFMFLHTSCVQDTLSTQYLLNPSL